MKIVRVDENTIALEEATPVELAFLMVGSERTAIKQARALYGIDQKTARLLVRMARSGTCSLCGHAGCIPGSKTCRERTEATP